jgi:hypothetical protein
MRKATFFLKIHIARLQDFPMGLEVWLLAIRWIFALWINTQGRDACLYGHGYMLIDIGMCPNLFYFSLEGLSIRLKTT